MLGKQYPCFWTGKVVRILFTFCLIHIAFSVEDLNLGVLLCKNCGETIAFAKDLKYYKGINSLKQYNQTLTGVKAVPVQLFQNPQGSQFNLITFSNSTVKSLEDVFTTATWFLGYSWRISICPRCGIHLGWKYQPKNFNHVTNSEDDTFYGLILEKLLEESVSDSFLYIPKSYKM